MTVILNKKECAHNNHITMKNCDLNACKTITTKMIETAKHTKRERIHNTTKVNNTTPTTLKSLHDLTNPRIATSRENNENSNK